MEESLFMGKGLANMEGNKKAFFTPKSSSKIYKYSFNGLKDMSDTFAWLTTC